MVIDFNSMVLNILYRYASATTQERSEGQDWYPAARRWCAERATEYGLSLPTVAATVSVLSPQVPWEHNLRWADECMAAHANGYPLPRRGLGTSLRRASIALSGDLSDVERSNGSLKVHNFYRSILGLPGSVCVDRHALRVAYGDPAYHSSRINKSEYYRVMGAYTDAALELDIGASTVQAVTWVVMKRERLA